MYNLKQNCGLMKNMSNRYTWYNSDPFKKSKEIFLSHESKILSNSGILHLHSWIISNMDELHLSGAYFVYSPATSPFQNNSFILSIHSVEKNEKIC